MGKRANKAAKSAVSMILSAAMVFSSAGWNAFASAATETSGASEAENITSNLPGEGVVLAEDTADKANDGCNIQEDTVTNDVLKEPVADTGNTFAVPASDVTAEEISLPVEPNPELSLSNGDITLNVGQDSLTYSQGGGANQPYSGVVTITQNNREQQLTNTVTINDVPEGGTSVADATAVIKLAGINTTGQFKIADDCTRDVTITLANKTDNILSSGLRKSGDEASGQLTIQAEEGATEETWGSLTATGEFWESGIGGGDSQSGSNITISGGMVSAVGGSYAAGIGGGYDNGGSNIMITGGNVTAKGGDHSAGIGGGEFGNASNITISGGTVNATGFLGGPGIGGGKSGYASGIMITGGTVTAAGGNNGSGIGGGWYASASDITISGGQVTAEGGNHACGIGGGNNASSEKIYINGGSVNASSFAGKAIGCQPVVSANDDTNVYLTTLTFDNGAPISNTLVNTLTTTYHGQPYAYGLKDAATDETGNFYAYLPEGTSTTSATVDGIAETFKPESEIVTGTTGTSGTLRTPFDVTVIQPFESKMF